MERFGFEAQTTKFSKVDKIVKKLIKKRLSSFSTTPRRKNMGHTDQIYKIVWARPPSSHAVVSHVLGWDTIRSGDFPWKSLDSTPKIPSKRANI